jgi:tRNA modification GTPase
LQGPSFSPDNDTIYAPSSGSGRAAISIIRLSGNSADTALRVLIVGEMPPNRVATLRTLRHPENGEPLDRALVIRFAAPRSFTGEPMVEIQITGGRAVLKAVLKALAALPGLRPAEAGEFAWRAFENGKLDLSQVEGLADLIDAQTEAQRRQALRVADGALSRQTDSIRGLLVQAMALVEARIDFSDQEDVDKTHFAEIRALASRAADAIRQTLKSANSGEALRDGFVVVIAGPPNVGKSTLMNALAHRDVSIVSAIPGTTRDAIEVHLDLRGYPVTLVDTAGLREADDPIEQEGITRARRRVASADLTLWLNDRDEAEASTAGPALFIRTKIDLERAAAQGFISPGGSRVGRIAISAETGAGIPELLDEIGDQAEQRFTGQGPALITLERHRLAFEEALKRVNACLEQGEGALEFIAEDLRGAARALQRIAGRIDVEEVLGAIFSRLCIGK